MKKELIFPVIVLLVALGAIITLVVLKARMPIPILLVRESGQVSYKVPGEQNFKKVTDDETAIPSGTTVKTDDGLAHVLLPDNSLISVDEKTEIQINFASGFVDIVQVVGRTWHRVMNLGSGKYQVNTPTALATVRGTIFGVNTNDETGLYVTESIVDIQQKDDAGKVGEATQITEGKHANVKNIKTQKGVNLGDMTDEQKNSPWFKRNRQLDEDFRNKSRDSSLDRIREIIRQRKSFEIRIKIEGAVSGDITVNEVACQNPARVVSFLDDKIARLEQRNVSPKNRETLIAFKNKFVETCNDGIASDEEIAALRNIASQLTNQTARPTGTNSPTQGVTEKPTATPTPTETVRGTKPTNTPTESPIR